MARSLIKLRQEAERARQEALEESLRRTSQLARPPPNFENAIWEARTGFESAVIRSPGSWQPRLKSRDPARLRLAAARHLFANYPVASHLEQIWLDRSGLDAAEVNLRKSWYVVVAGGGSLFKSGTAGWLTRKEIHTFLNPPAPLRFEEALWHAIAASYASESGTALRIAHSRIARTPRAELTFWREAARFFCVNPTTREEIGDMCDFLVDALRRNGGQFTFKGRTLGTLRRQMREWHRDLAEVARINAMRQRAADRQYGPGTVPDCPAWPGALLKDWSWNPAAKDRQKREEYLMVQLRTAAELVAETRAMHHCVSTYAQKCVDGRASIWSLRQRTGGTVYRLLTIELDAQLRAVQVRGFANRQMRTEERALLERWAKARGIHLLS